MAAASLVAQRLYNQQIENPRLNNPGKIVSSLGAIQGQDYAGAKWSVGLRLPGSTDADIEAAIADTTLVRTWVMRGTLHILAGADVRWMVELIAPRIIAGNARRYRQLELDEPTFARSNTVLVDALAGGKRLTRKELFPIMEANGISTEGQRGVYLLQRASFDGLIAQGVAERNYPTFLRLDEYFPNAPSLPRDVALAELARRYFTSRGPVTIQDFIGWSGLVAGDARAGFEAIKSELVQEKIDGTVYWLRPTEITNPAPSPTVYLLPGFDEYLLGYKDRDMVLHPQYATHVCPGKNGIFFPTIVSDGRIVGIWKRTFKKRQVIITAEPFEGLSQAEWDSFDAAAERYGQFLEMPVVLQI